MVTVTSHQDMKEGYAELYTHHEFSVKARRWETS